MCLLLFDSNTGPVDMSQPDSRISSWFTSEEIKSLRYKGPKVLIGNPMLIDLLGNPLTLVLFGNPRKRKTVRR